MKDRGYRAETVADVPTAAGGRPLLKTVRPEQRVTMYRLLRTLRIGFITADAEHGKRPSTRPGAFDSHPTTFASRKPRRR